MRDELAEDEQEPPAGVLEGASQCGLHSSRRQSNALELEQQVGLSSSLEAAARVSCGLSWRPAPQLAQPSHLPCPSLNSPTERFWCF